MRLAWGDFVVEAEGAPGWLFEFLAPAFRETDAAPAARVSYVLDQARYAALSAFVPPESRVVSCFTRDGGFSELPARDGVLHDAAARVVLALAPDGAAVVAEADHAKARTALMRVVRELATAHALARGMLPLHASAVSRAGRVVAFAGPRRSGKSTLLLHALARGARFVTNDRLFVDGGFARPMPTIVALREETLARFPAPEARLRAARWDRARSLAEDGHDGRWPPRLSPAQLCAALGVEAAGGGPLGAIVFCSIAREPGFSVRELPPVEAAAWLSRSLFPLRAPDAFAAACVPPRVEVRVPCLAVRLGEGAYDPPFVWEAISARLWRDAPAPPAAP